MAKIIWEEWRDGLVGVVGSTSGMEEEIALGLIDELERYGEPYNAAYTPSIDQSKINDQLANDAALSDWADAVAVDYAQAVIALNEVEDGYTDLSTIPYDPYTSADFQAMAPSTLATVRSFIGTKLGVYAAKCQTTENKVLTFQNVGMPEVLQEYRDTFYASVDSRPSPSYVGSYGNQPIVLVEGKGRLTVQQTESFLEPIIEQAQRMVQLITS